ncbi:lipopolysaccharide biosynthesis protein [Bacteroidetes bacterium endosymbiont of Geopemphigus sp.]|uniref:lipopolysaccharide biosynthesis protein n=1 Tax=Bacteroidetes bacterium endosymbiont of Geopemphigus sp. TaxID=2047937 RepID=UPI000CD2788C|nr:oligosaccharide flippase family protein [Bacteroidetes bacterium endosymbiont of Geopemphigus sp.]
MQFRLKSRNFVTIDLIHHFLYKKLFGDTIIYGIGAVLPRLINYGFLKFFTSVLDKEGFSFYADMYAISFLLISILTFGLESAYFRFVYKQKNTDRNKVFSSGILSLLFIALTFLTIVMFFVKEISYFAGYEAHREYFSMFFLIIFFETISSLPMAWLRIHNKALRYTLIRIINACLQAFVTFWLLSGNSESPADFFSFLNGIKGYTDKTGYIFYANMIASIISFLCLFDIIIKIRFKKFRLKLALEMLAYGTSIMLGTLAFAINENLDKILIKRWLSDEVNGAYAACYRIAAFMALYATAFRLGIEPFYFRKAKDANAKETYSQLTYLFTLFGTVFFALLWSNLNWISHFMIGANYQSARNIIPVIMMANLFLGIYTNLSITYKVKDRPIIGTYISLIGALVTVLSNFLMIQQLGYVASAWGTLVSYGSMMLISYWWGQKYYRINYPVTQLCGHLILGVLVGYCLGEKFPYYNVIGQLLYLYVVFFIEKSTLIKILHG